MVWAIFSSRIAKLMCFLVCDHDALVGLCMQDYKSLGSAVTIYATVVDPKFDCNILTPVTLKRR